MMLVPFLTLFLTAAAFSPAAPAPPASVASVPVSDVARSSVWRASLIVSSDGELLRMPGWRVRLGPGGRARLVGPEARTPQASGLWDDEAEAAGLVVSVRVAASDARATYVEGRMRRGDASRRFVLRWDAATGTWTEATA